MSESTLHPSHAHLRDYAVELMRSFVYCQMDRRVYRRHVVSSKVFDDDLLLLSIPRFVARSPTNVPCAPGTEDQVLGKMAGVDWLKVICLCVWVVREAASYK